MIDENIIEELYSSNIITDLEATQKYKNLLKEYNTLFDSINDKELKDKFIQLEKIKNKLNGEKDKQTFKIGFSLATNMIIESFSNSKKVSIKKLPQKSEIIRDIYNNYFIDSISYPNKYYEVGDQIDILKKEIVEHLSKDYVEKLDNLCQLFLDLELIDSEESFITGYSAATQITAEAFLTKYNKNDEKE